MTRFEKIKEMTVEELTNAIDKMHFTTNAICKTVTNCPYMDEEGDISDDCDCTESEVTENEND